MAGVYDRSHLIGCVPGALTLLSDALRARYPFVKLPRQKIGNQLARVTQGTKAVRLGLTDRNQRMADRVLARLQENPEKTHFFAIGAMHFDGDDGILALLEEADYPAKRITAAEADALQELLSRTPAAGH